MAVFGTLGTCCSYLPILYRAENKKKYFKKMAGPTGPTGPRPDRPYLYRLLG